jgi:hypothetical protein
MKIFGNKAVGFSLAYRAWQGSAGLLTIPLITQFLASTTQGYYYTFASLVALQSFFELGLSIVISVFASHEWHKLGLDEHGAIAGDADSRSRLVSLGRFVFAYFGVAALAYAMIAGATGFLILNRQADAGVDWVLPWTLQIVFSALNLWMMPMLSLLEGCDQVARVAKFRLLQSLLSNLALWAGLASGLGLWSLPLFSCVSLLLLLGFLAVRERHFFATFRERPRGATLSWKRDLLPMQWRLAVQGLFGYLSFPLFTIIMYVHAGAVEAGRMGMTLQIITGIQAFSMVFLIARAPEFALLAAAGQPANLIARCRHAAVLAAAVMAAMCGAVICVLAVATHLGLPQVGRVLGIGAFAVFSSAIILMTPIQAIALYLRAHKKELLTAVGALGGLLYGSTAWFSGVAFGAFGMAVSHLLVTACVVLPFTLWVLKTNQARLHA